MIGDQSGTVGGAMKKSLMTGILPKASAFFCPVFVVDLNRFARIQAFPRESLQFRFGLFLIMRGTLIVAHKALHSPRHKLFIQEATAHFERIFFYTPGHKSAAHVQLPCGSLLR